MATGNPFTTAQAPAGLQMLAPDLAAQQMQLSRQQKIADMLREQSMTPMGDTQTIGGWAIQKSPLEGLAKLAQALGANRSQSQTDEKQLSLSKALMGRMGDILGGGGSDPSASALTQGAAQQPSTPDASGEMVNQGGVGPTLANALRMDSAPKAAPNNFTMGNLLKGQVIGDLGGQAAGAAYWDGFKPTEGMKTDKYLGYSPQESRTTEDAKRFKEGYIAPVNARPGSILRDPKTNMPIAYNPHIPDGAAPTFDASGNVTGMNPINGALPLIQANARALAAGKAEVTPQSGFDGNGNPVFTNQLSAATGGAGASGGAPGGTSPVNVGRFGSYKAPGGAVAPGLAPGVATAAEGQAAQNTKRSGVLVDSASDSPTRVNVLDNILQLSRDGVATGPTAEWTNKVKGVVGSVPGFTGWKDDVTGYQEMKKFLNQNAIRAWTAAGGTGTDTQMNAAMQANPNDKMFPAAVQKMAQWAKAGELALQSKASAQDDWLSRNANNPQAQNQFESAWRKNFDPRVYQLKQMEPAEMQGFVAKMPANERAALLQKYSTAKQNGWIQ